MGLDRYLGFHFTDNCIFVAESFVGRDGRMAWDILRQANYELPPEWLPLFQTGIPNFYDTEGRLYGFAALPAIWRGFSWDRFIRFDHRFFEETLKKGLTSENRTRLQRLFRYCQIYHIRSQPDERLHALIVFERLSQAQCKSISAIFRDEIAAEARIDFVGTIDPRDACLQYVLYEHQNDPRAHDLENRRVLVVNLGYDRTTMTPLDKAQLVEPSTQAPGMRHVDDAIAHYVGRLGLGRTIGMDELMLYAQRARRSFAPGQMEVLVVDKAIPAAEYIEVVRGQVKEIAVRLEQGMRPQAGKRAVDEILLVGEGTAFAPVHEALRAASRGIPMRPLGDEPVFAVAKGAAVYCWESLRVGEEAH